MRQPCPSPGFPVRTHSLKDLAGPLPARPRGLISAVSATPSSRVPDCTQLSPTSGSGHLSSRSRPLPLHARGALASSPPASEGSVHLISKADLQRWGRTTGFWKRLLCFSFRAEIYCCSPVIKMLVMGARPMGCLARPRAGSLLLRAWGPHPHAQL